MTNLKLYKFILLSFLIPVLFVACDESVEDDMLDEDPFLDVSAISINANGIVPFTDIFEIKSNLQWVISEHPSWVDLDKTEGENNQTITINISSSEKNHRTGNIEIMSADGNFSKTVEIKQNGNTLSAVTGDYLYSKVTAGAFKGTDNKQYKYKHEIYVEFFINGSHLASEYGVTGSTIKGSLKDGKHSTKLLLYSNRERTTFTYRAFATKKSTGEKVYGEERTIISAAE